MVVLPLVEIGDEVGVILPDSALAKLGVGCEDTVYLVENADRPMTLMSVPPEATSQRC